MSGKSKNQIPCFPCVVATLQFIEFVKLTPPAPPKWLKAKANFITVSDWIKIFLIS